jgi:arylsulfatase A-like enzyme
MLRRMPRRFAWIAAVALIAFACAVRAPGLHAPRPNVLVLVTDDQRWDSLGCCGDQRLQTPSLDALASEGVRFANAFVTTSICAASRASILTGLYESRHGFTFGTPPLANEHVDTSYPTQLRRAGYRTGFVGKFGIAVEKGASQRMFDVFEPLAGPPLEQRAGESQATHRCDRATDRAISFLDSCDPKQPWCLSVSFQEPHAEDGDPRQYVWSSAFDSLYDDVTFAEPATMKPEFFAALPQFLRESESRVRFRWRFDEEQKRQRMVRGYHRLIAAIDASVGRIQRALRERGMADNTVIVFTSDNGYFLGERGFADKWYAYEPSIRVPLIVLDPRDPPSLRGVVRNEMALNVDLAPTILELAGTLPPTSCQGESLAPLLRGEAPKQWRTEFFYEHRFAHPRIPKSEGLRDERYAYIRWIERSPIVEELYDHVADFDQVRDLSQSPEHATTLAAMRARCDAAAAHAAARPQ